MAQIQAEKVIIEKHVKSRPARVTREVVIKQPTKKVIEKVTVAKRKVKSNARLVGDLVAVNSGDFMRNIKANANKNLAKTLAWGALGAVLYPLVPTVLQSATNSDWSGYKGLLTGVGAAAVLGLATGKPEITVGACAASGTHLLYSKGTGAIEKALKTQIFRMNPENVVYAEDVINEANNQQEN